MSPLWWAETLLSIFVISVAFVPIGGQFVDYGTNSLIPGFSSLAVDTASNLYIVGGLQSNLNLNLYDSTSSPVDTLTSQSFLAKFSSSGSFLNRTSYSDASLTDIALDSSSQPNIYVSGSFTSNTAFPTLTSPAPGANALVFKLNNAGTLEWAVSFGTTGTNVASSIAVSSTAVYVTGQAVQSSIIDGIACSNSSCMFVLKLNATDGTVIWSSMSPTTSRGVSIAVDSQGNAVVVGICNAALMNISTISKACTTVAPNNVFIAKYSSGSTLAWLVTVGGAGDDEISDVVFSPADSTIYCVGFTQSSAASYGNFLLSSIGGVNTGTYFTLSSSDGTVSNAMTTPSGNNYAIALDGVGRVVIGGASTSPTLFNQASIDSGGLVFRLNQQGLYDYFRRMGDTNAQ